MPARRLLLCRCSNFRIILPARQMHRPETTWRKSSCTKCRYCPCFRRTSLKAFTPGAQLSTHPMSRSGQRVMSAFRAYLSNFVKLFVNFLLTKGKKNSPFFDVPGSSPGFEIYYEKIPPLIMIQQDKKRRHKLEI